MTHLSASEIEAVVMGTAPADARMRAHLRECAACAARLAREAQLEEALHASARNAVAGVVASPRSGRVFVWALAAALAVVVAVWLVRAPGRTPAAPAPVAAPARPARAAGADVPGLVDPLWLAPGYSVVPPGDAGRDVGLELDLPPGIATLR